MQLFLKSFLVVLLIFGVIWGYTQEVPYFSNTFEISYLFFRSMFLGVILGGLAGWFLSKKAPDKSDRVPIVLICVFAGMTIFPLLGIASNHILSKSSPLSVKNMKVIFQKEEALRTSRMGLIKNSPISVDAFYVYFTKDFKTDRIRCKNQNFNHIEAGTEIELPLRKGFWGFDFVEIQ